VRMLFTYQGFILNPLFFQFQYRFTIALQYRITVRSAARHLVPVPVATGGIVDISVSDP
jgi:hypothetical protein